jgi:hypothetical protein
VGTTSPGGELTGDFGNKLEAISIGDGGLFRLLAENYSHGILGLLQQYLPIPDSCTAANGIFIRSPRPRAADWTSAGFSAFLATYKRDAAALDISPRALAAPYGLTPDPTVISLDRGQGHFNQNFEQFAAARITSGRLPRILAGTGSRHSSWGMFREQPRSSNRRNAAAQG